MESRFPAYHCSRGGHKYFRIKKRDFEGTIQNFIKNVRISKKYIETLKKEAITEWKRRMEETKSDYSEIDNKIEELQFNMKGLTEKIKVVSVESVIKSIESDVVRLEEEIKLLEVEKDKKDSEYINMKVIMDNIEYFLEHIEDLLLGSADPLKRAAYFGILFKQAPTYNDLLFGTPQLEPCIELNEVFKRTQSLNVGNEGLEPPTSSV